MSTELVMLSNHLIFCSTPLPPAFNPSQKQKFFSMSWLLTIRGSNYWSFSINPSNEYSELISFRVDWLDLLSVQGTRMSLLQHHSSKASVLWQLAFFPVHFSHPHMTTGKTIALTIWAYAGKVLSLFFNTLSRFIMEKEITTHSSILTGRIPWTKELVCYPYKVAERRTWLKRLSRQIYHNFPSKEEAYFILMTAVLIGSDFGDQENEISHWFYFPPFYWPWRDEPRCHDLNDTFLILSLKSVFFFFSHSPLSHSSRGSLVVF